MNRRNLAIFLLAGAVSGSSAAQAAFISYTGGTYNQDFNALPSSGVNGSSQARTELLGRGWYIGPTNKNFSAVGQTDGLANSFFNPADPGTVTFSTGAQAGSQTANPPGRAFNWGVAGTNPVTDRALGLATTGIDSAIEARFTNQTGDTIRALTIRYDGEQWRQSGQPVPSGGSSDPLQFAYGFDGVNFTPVPGLNFFAPQNPGGAAAALDGNAPANRRANIQATIAGLAIPNGESFFLRWYDSNQSGTEQGKAIDNFSLKATFGPPPPLAPTHVYDFNGNTDDQLGGPGMGITNLDGLEATGYRFGPTEGPYLVNAVDATTYSIEMRFLIDSTLGYKKLLDFKNGNLDAGLYNLSSRVTFYPVADGSDSVFMEGQMHDLIVTRDGGTKTVEVYVDGVPRLSFVDTNDYAAFDGPENIIGFLIDDFAFSGEDPSGFLDRVRIYDVVISASEAAALHVPEPSAAALLLIGAAAPLHQLRRRQPFQRRK